MRTWILIAGLVLTVAPSVRSVVAGSASLTFTDVGAARGIGRYVMAKGMGGGVAAADYDSDGDIDIFVPTAAGWPDRLYRNLGDGHYEEVASVVGVASLQKNRVALWFDYDGDHDLDLLVANDVEDAASGFLLYRQSPDGLFEDVTTNAGLAVPSPVRIDAGVVPHRGGMCVGDINNDGFLDLYAAMWNAKPQLFVNNGDGTFSDRSSESGVNTALYYAHQPVMADFDGDGWVNIYVAIDFLHNALYLNQRDGTFVDVAPLVGLNNAMNDMGVTLGDPDNDGDLDSWRRSSNIEPVGSAV